MQRDLDERLGLEEGALEGLDLSDTPLALRQLIYPVVPIGSNRAGHRTCHGVPIQKQGNCEWRQKTDGATNQTKQEIKIQKQTTMGKEHDDDQENTDE